MELDGLPTKEAYDIRLAYLFLVPKSLIGKISLNYAIPPHFHALFTPHQQNQNDITTNMMVMKG